MSKFKDNPDGYSEQIRSMRNDGKTYEEIRGFFKETYGITLYDAQIAKIMKGIKISVPPKVRSGERKKIGKPGKTIIEICSLKVICKFADICQPAICRFKGA